MNQDFNASGFKIEKAIRLLCQKFLEDSSSAKPTLFHSVRVGNNLYKNDYKESVVIGGFLHDVLEDTKTTENEINDLFGKEVTDIVKANTKNKNLNDRHERHRELIQRCVETSEDAAIVKAADILDNFDYYKRINSQDGIEYCKNNSRLLQEFLPKDYSDPIFQELNQI